MRQTTILKHKEIKKKWFVIDANNQIVGKIATFVVSCLRGKTNPSFTANVDMGNNIIIINAKKVILSANKEKQKIYYSHSGYPGGLKAINALSLRKKKPTKILEKAIKGMLPHTKLGRKQFKNLYIYANEKHNQEAQMPQKLEIK